ncbi:MAG: hypothetical protein LBQ88_23185 [Treponema sp.]|jgi:hypothetical protein|nr:hypothetical protein [Treponema sp.]
MDQLCIRRVLEEKVMEIGGKITGAGFMMIPPFTMDFGFELDGKRYEITLVDLEEKRKARENPPKEYLT